MKFLLTSDENFKDYFAALVNRSNGDMSGRLERALPPQFAVGRRGGAGARRQGHRAQRGPARQPVSRWAGGRARPVRVGGSPRGTSRRPPLRSRRSVGARGGR